jgi:PAS domain S-box-containing protein
MKVLIVEDDAAIRRLVTDHLEKRGITVTEARDVGSALLTMQHNAFHIAILDLSLPDGSGLEVLAALRHSSSATHVIILSGAATEADRVRALELGADDYVVKPFFARELAARVLAVRRRRDLSKDSHLVIGHLDIDLAARRVLADGKPLEFTPREFDLLAFLAARPGYAFSRDDLLRAVWQSAPDWQAVATVTEHVRRVRVKIERDAAKPELLRTVRGAGYRFDRPADDLPEAGSPDDVVTANVTHVPSSRLRHLVTGVLSEVSDAVIVTDLLLQIRSWNQAAERLYGWREEEVLGSHVHDIIRKTRSEAELADAVRQLETSGRWYGEGQEITRDGSTITVCATTTMVRDEAGFPLGVVSISRPAQPAVPSEEGLGNSQDEAEIRRGIADDEFVVYYQPVVDLDSGGMIAVEALVRWDHPDRGVLSPASFIGTAEDTGLILALGRVVLEKACAQVAGWRRDGAAIEVAVNLSAKELADHSVVDRITSTLEATGLDPCALWLEVTETALVEDVEQATELLHRLASLGIRIAIDDFGTGWASLTYLKQFPVHALKIDRTFVSGVDQNANDHAIARSVVSLGAELGIDVVAEGIETRGQATALRALGCQVGQGFLFGKPTPAEFVPVDTASRLA